MHKLGAYNYMLYLELYLTAIYCAFFLTNKFRNNKMNLFPQLPVLQVQAFKSESSVKSAIFTIRSGMCNVPGN